MAPSIPCPQCGHVQEFAPHPDNNAERTMICGRCQAQFQPTEDMACAQWDQYCQETPLPAEV